MVGQRIIATLSDTTLTTSPADITGASLALTKGSWEIKYSVSMVITTATNLDAVTFGSVVITNSSNTEIGTSYRTASIKNRVAGTTMEHIGCLSASEVVDISADTTYKLRCVRNDAVANGVAQVATTSVYKSNFYAIRIA
jgi:hypothetical protein